MLRNKTQRATEHVDLCEDRLQRVHMGLIKAAVIDSLNGRDWIEVIITLGIYPLPSMNKLNFIHHRNNFLTSTTIY